jgi:hypothetical protein
VFKWRDDPTQLVLDLLSNQECSWNIKSENYRNRNIRDKTLEEMVTQLNIPDLTQEDVKLKIKSIRSRYSFELAKVLKSEKSGAGRKTVLETFLNDFYTYLDLHLSIQLTMCLMHLICCLIIHGLTHQRRFFFYFFFSEMC